MSQPELQPLISDLDIPTPSITVDGEAKDTSSKVELIDINDELFSIINLAWPIILAEFIQTFPMLFNMRLAGMLGTQELATTALCMSFFVLFCLSPLAGILTALDTLLSQSFTGSSNKHQVGIYAQTSFLILSLIMIPIAIVCLFIEPILIWSGQTREQSALAGIYMAYFFPVLPGFIYGEILKKFMQAQGITKPSFYIAIILAPLYYLLAPLVVNSDGLNLGLIGIPISLTIYSGANLLLHLLACKVTKASQCWGGFSMLAFKNWLLFLKIGFPGMVLIAGATWPIEFISVTVSYFGTTLLSAQAVLVTSLQLSQLLFAGIAVSGAIRIGNHLGSKLPNKARLTAYVTLSIGAVLGFVLAVILLIFRKKFIQMISNDVAVMEIAYSLLGFVAMGQWFVAVGTLASGLLRGIGQQRIGAFFKVSGTFLISIPLGWYLATTWDLNLLGLWIGLIVNWVYACLGESIAVLKSDWHEQVVLCEARISHHLTVTPALYQSVESNLA